MRPAPSTPPSAPLRRLLPLLLLVATACGPEIVQREIFSSENGEVKVVLRQVLDGDDPVPRGYTHPTTISDVRMAHILAQIQFKDADDKTRAALRNAHIYPLAEGLVKALEQAGPDDEVIAEVFLIDRRFGIFTVEKSTVLRVALVDGFLHIHFFAIDEKITPDNQANKGRGIEIPLELPAKPTFRVIPSIKQTQATAVGVAVDWRDPYFARPVSVSGRGNLRRRTILMEAEPEGERPPEIERPVFTEALRNAQIEALDALDEQRRTGVVTEADFLRRRRLVLEGRLEEAGFPTTPSAE